ncbi:helix-turn-helix domain-containing protein [Bacillus solitudinis]|uniref:helix-turn-helix domain-containing protein n=1 Tax=Bacillus solitudinis TaxID=2014074 RepID=UPI000C2375D5|nr:helix-turn-helix transcriptional regulator [Bacillus solitudinis]
MFRLNKKRSKVKKFLDVNGYSQEDLVNATKVSRNTISKVCSDPDYTPSTGVIKKIMKAIREIDPSAKSTDFFDL